MECRRYDGRRSSGLRDLGKVLMDGVRSKTRSKNRTMTARRTCCQGDKHVFVSDHGEREMACHRAKVQIPTEGEDIHDLGQQRCGLRPLNSLSLCIDESNSAAALNVSRSWHHTQCKMKLPRAQHLEIWMANGNLLASVTTPTWQTDNEQT